jgi:hypothetical protein
MTSERPQAPAVGARRLGDQLLTRQAGSQDREASSQHSTGRLPARDAFLGLDPPSRDIPSSLALRADDLAVTGSVHSLAVGVLGGATSLHRCPLFPDRPSARRPVNALDLVHESHDVPPWLVRTLADLPSSGLTMDLRLARRPCLCLAGLILALQRRSPLRVVADR